MHPMAIRLILALALTALALPLHAATRVVWKSPEGKKHEMLIEDQKVRANAPTGNAYMLFDLEKEEKLAVNPGRQMALEMPTEGDQIPEADYDLKDQGSGPEILGYATTHYVLEAGGEHCSDLYTSKEALADGGGAELVQVMQGLAASSRRGGQNLSACDKANQALAGRMEELGFILRAKSSDGEQEVVQLDTGVDVPDGTFAVPEGFTQKSYQEMMESMGQGQGQGQR